VLPRSVLSGFVTLLGANKLNVAVLIDSSTKDTGAPAGARTLCAGVAASPRTPPERPSLTLNVMAAVPI
jgi:hypothetical protein